MVSGGESASRGRRRLLALGLPVAGAALAVFVGLAIAPKSRSACGSVEELAATQFYACARLTDGSVRCWGDKIPTVKGYANEPARIPFERAATRLFAEGHTICTGVEAGDLLCLGSNQTGQLAQPLELAFSEKPVPHVLRGVTGISHRGNCAIAEGELRCWRWPEEFRTPRAVQGLPARPKQVTGGNHFSCVLLENGEVFCRGSNLRGQLGIGAAPAEAGEAAKLRQRHEFTKLTGLGSDVRQIAAGAAHSCALKADGSIWCWGENEHGAIGNGEISRCEYDGVVRTCRPDDARNPTQVRGLPERSTALGLGDGSSCAISGAGEVYCWGRGSAVPAKVPLQTPAVSVAPSGRFVCALLRDERVECWGELAGAWSAEKPLEVALPCP